MKCSKEIYEEVRLMIEDWRTKGRGERNRAPLGIREIDKDTQYLIKCADDGYRDIWPDYWDLET